MTEARRQNDILVKVVPGAKRDEIAGMLGDRLKIRVAAPPEGGKANAAVCSMIAESLGLKARQVEIISGHSAPEKSVRISGMDIAEARTRLGMTPE